MPPKLTSKRKRNQKEAERRPEEEEEEEEEVEEEEVEQEEKGGRKSGASSSGAAGTSASGAPQDDRVWVQCNTCDKWRALPSTVDPAKLPDIWYCELNVYDPLRNTCSVSIQRIFLSFGKLFLHCRYYI
jgi:outer membrane biosynthesis protein TonB